MCVFLLDGGFKYFCCSHSHTWDIEGSRGGETKDQHRWMMVMFPVDVGRLEHAATEETESHDARL